ncbi:hypothetical protein [Plebeiibacterium marinum]|uniref:Solute-binding protein family 3/N-terminal domain-containing protein n=1 Tax=Plebeiibacterium marinum TaxID=2992111 RepID=A0AAE3MHM7_9BACT|nr:hypothetical protein [Plebeiobacterium marinum]MCW3807911.1 hypothetical protein [Plebeiobacterium marinum]
MKLTIHVFFILLFMAGCHSGQQVKPLKPIHVATGNWQPFIGEDLPQNGPVAQMIASILIELDYLPIFKYYDWGFVHTHLEAGYPSFAFPYIKSEDSTTFKYSKPIVHIEYVLYYYNKTGHKVYHYKTVQDLVNSNKHIGRIRGYTKFPGIDEDSVYVEVPNTIDGFKMLVDGDIDFLIEARPVGKLTVMSSEIPADASDFCYLGQSDKPNTPDDSIFVKDLPFHIKFSPKVSDEFVDNINMAISTCSKTEYYKSLTEKLRKTQQEFLKAYLFSANHDLIYGYTTSDIKQPAYILPLSTEVVVTQWSKIFKEAFNSPKRSVSGFRSQVKIMNGPLKGKTMWVANEQIELSKK